ncbi:MAG: glycine oxidase ThiO [Candidatus Dormibacteria bacterium]
MERTNVVVVGGGVIGLACAWRAAQRGLTVTLLERSSPGAGASGVAAGMLAPTGEVDFGQRGFAALTMAAADAWPGFAADLEQASDAAVPYRRCGALWLAADRDEAEELRRLHQGLLHLGSGGEWLTSSACRELEPGLGACAAGVLLPDDAEVDPRRVLAALVVACARAGVRLHTQAEVVEASWDGGRITGVITAAGARFEAQMVVAAQGCWAPAWLPESIRPPVRPVKGQVLRLRGPSVCSHVIRSERVYLVPRATGELVVGATTEERGFDTTVTAGAVLELLEEAHRILPGVGELELVEASAGLRPGSPDNSPLVGLAEVPGLVLATGHYRAGVLLAPLTADAVAAVLAGGDPAGALRDFSIRRRVGAAP